MPNSHGNSTAEHRRLDDQFADTFDAPTGAEAEYGFDITDFGEAWPAFAGELGLIDAGRVGDSVNGFVWRNAAGLMVVTGNNPETGEYRDARMRQPQTGFASYMGAEGPADQIAAFVAGVRRHAVYVKGWSHGSRSYI